MFEYKSVRVTPETADDLITPYLLEGWKLILLGHYTALLERRKQ